MKRNVFFTTCLLVLLTTNVFSQNKITRDQAYKIIKQKGLVDTLENTVRASTQIIPANTVIKLMIDSIISPASNCWFFFIDQKPYYDWAHPCKYVFLNTTDTSLTIINGQFDAYLPTNVLLGQKNKYPLPTPDFIKKKSPVSKIKPIQKNSIALPERNYAILINGGGAHPNSNPLRYWNNLSLVFRTLLERNYARDRIFVLSSDGTNPNPDTTYDDPDDPYANKNLPNFSQNTDLDDNYNEDHRDDIEYAATKTNVSTVFTNIQAQLATDVIAGFKTNIFIYVTDHGCFDKYGYTSANVALWMWDQKNMSPAELIVELRKLSDASFIQILMDQCYSGGFADEIKKTDIKAVIATSCKFNQIARSSGATGYSHYLYEWISGIRGKRLDGDSDISYLVDSNHDGFICFEEASVYAKNRVEFFNQNSQYYSSPFGCGRYIAIDKLQPEAYCNNGKQDNGEIGVDCGGSCGNTCNGVIIVNPPIPKCETCNDGIKNQDESGTDCGGANCQPCGLGGGLNDIASVSECKYRDDQIVPFGNAPSIFSGSNILTTDNIKLSHGGFTISYRRGDFSLKAPVPFLEVFFPLIYKTETYHIYPSASLAGSGIFFEESGYQFKPNIDYKITFNFSPDMIYDNTVVNSYRYGQLHFSLANDLTDVTVNKQYYPSTENYFFSSDKNDIPFLSSQFYIGNINRVDNQCWGNYSYYSYDEGNGVAFYHSTPNKYNEVSLKFKPDGFYKQLWIFTSKNTTIDINSLKIEEEYLDYSQDVYIQNTTINGNKLIKGKNIYVGNHVTTDQPSGDVLINNGANVIFDCKTITFDAGFECASGSSYEVKNH